MVTFFWQSVQNLKELLSEVFVIDTLDFLDSAVNSEFLFVFRPIDIVNYLKKK